MQEFPHSFLNPVLNLFIEGQVRIVLKFAQQNLKDIRGRYQSNSFTKLEQNGIGEYQQNMVFIALITGKEMEFVPILSSELVNFKQFIAKVFNCEQNH